MYLSRVELDLKRKDTYIKLLTSPQVVHASVEGCFTPPANGVKPRKLWRVDSLHGKKYLLVLSDDKPDFTGIVEQFCAKDIQGDCRSYLGLLDSIRAGNVYSFKLVANPTKEINGKKKALSSVEEQVAWLRRKADGLGFKLYENTLITSPSEWVTFKRKDMYVELNKITFEGLLEVTDAEDFECALKQGIGRGKAYGCGLLTIVPVGN